MKVLADGYLLRDDGVIEIDSDVVYPKLMAEIGGADEALTQYSLTIIAEFAKLDAGELARLNGVLREGAVLQLHIVAGKNKERWQIARRPEGLGVAPALGGKLRRTEGDARRLYRQLRGRV